MSGHRTTSVYGVSHALLELNGWPSNDTSRQEDSGIIDTVTLLPQRVNAHGFTGGVTTDLNPSPADPRWILDYIFEPTAAITRNGSATDTGFVLEILGGTLTYASSTPTMNCRIGHVVLVGTPVTIQIGPSGGLPIDIGTYQVRSHVGTIRGTARYVQARASGCGTAPASFRLGVYLRVFP